MVWPAVQIETFTVDDACAGALQRELEPLARETSIEETLTGDIFDVREPQSDHHSISLERFDAVAARARVIVSDLLPKEICARIQGFADTARQHPVMVLKGCPLGQISATPEQYNSKSDSAIGGHLIAAICSLLRGRIVTLLNAISHSVDQQGWSAPLGLHIDGHFAGKPNVAVLLCLKGATGARTVFITLDEVVRHLSQQHLDTLQQPILKSAGGNHAVVVFAADRWHFHDLQQANQFYFDPDDVVDPSAVDALRAFQRLGTDLLDSATGVELETGDIVVFDNQIKSSGPVPGLLHGRSRFIDHPAPSQRRWVKALVFEI
jgi:alpha-ketoglutarate-dependent taurine dioxygenase